MRRKRGEKSTHSRTMEKFFLGIFLAFATSCFATFHENNKQGKETEHGQNAKYSKAIALYCTIVKSNGKSTKNQVNLRPNSKPTIEKSNVEKYVHILISLDGD